MLTVAVDDEQAAFDSLSLALIKKGHKRIGFIGTNSSAISSTARENGLYKSIKMNMARVKE